jgi:anti-sigma B factor antagonist
MSSPAPAIGTQAKPVVVTLPAEIDISNAAAVEAQLLAACAPGLTIIADLSATTFCDSSGIRALLTAHQHAAADDARFRAVVPPGPVRRMLALTAFDTILNIFPTVTEALAAGYPDPLSDPPAAA